MQRRTLIILAVFVAGFGAGYGTTWIVVGSPTAATKAGPAIAPAPTNVAALADAGGSPGAVSDAGVAAAGTGAPEGDAGTSAAGADAATEDAATSVAAAPDAGPEGVAGVAPPTAPPDPAVGDPKTPTSLCVNAVCRIDFGKVSGGLSVREGHLEDGQVIDWARDFGKAEKIGTIPHSARNKPTRVEVKAIGLADGEPAAAWVVYKGKKGKSLEGVIALRLGEKSVTLVPEPDAAKRDP
jgi:hypothetical protein